MSLVSVQLNRAPSWRRRLCLCRGTTGTALSESHYIIMSRTFPDMRVCSRKNARLKYTVDRMGLDVYKSAVEALLGYPLSPARPYTFDRNVDDYGWVKGQNGKHHFTMFVENGRIQDEPGKEFKSGLAELARTHKGTFRLTANQHLIVADVPEQNLVEVKAILRKWSMDNLSQTGLRLSSSACVAFPTCGLAMAESERVSFVQFFGRRRC